MNGDLYISDATKRFRELHEQCDRAIAQVPYERWTERLDPESNSIVTLMLHLSGNMLSRWTDFLTSDGEKPTRDRDAEFEDAPSLSRDALMARWNDGWRALFSALATLTDSDLERAVTIRTQTLSVVSAINRQLVHYGVHTGQLVFLAKHLAGANWQTLSIARGQSQQFNQQLSKKA